MGICTVLTGDTVTTVKVNNYLDSANSGSLLVDHPGLALPGRRPACTVTNSVLGADFMMPLRMFLMPDFNINCIMPSQSFEPEML